MNVVLYRYTSKQDQNTENQIITLGEFGEGREYEIYDTDGGQISDVNISDLSFLN